MIKFKHIFGGVGGTSPYMFYCSVSSLNGHSYLG